MKLTYTFLLASICALLFPAAARSQDTASAVRSDSIHTVTVDSRDIVEVDIESMFPGGARAWLQFLNDHLVYPKKAVRKKIEGTVLLQFIVNKDGTISDLKALSGDPILVEAALNAMVDCPRWIPAEQNGRKVKSYKKQPIVFKIP